MLFNLFGENSAETANRYFADKVYINSEAKMNACVQWAIHNPNTIFVAWFAETAVIYKAFFTKNGLDENLISIVELLEEQKITLNQPIVFLEHYPLNAKELLLVENWDQKNIPVFSAMDEPLFKHFGSDKMIPLIKLFGMKESAAIEHSYVTQSITKGQAKITDKVIEEQTANSQAAWMQLNLGAPIQ